MALTLPTGSVAAVADAAMTAISLAADINTALNAADMQTAKTKASLLLQSAQMINDLLAQDANPTPANQAAVIKDLGP